MIKKTGFLFLFLIALVSRVVGESISLPTRGESFFVETNQAKLFCRSMGKGSPVIVLHGGPGLSHDYLLPYLEKLGENHSVIFYDQRGSGRSIGKKNEATINLDMFVMDLEAIRQHLGLKKVSLLGHSWGSLLAMQYAISHPEVIDKLILLSSSPCSSKEFALFQEECGHRLAPFKEKLEEIQSSKEFLVGDPKAHTDYLKTIFRTYSALPEKVEELYLEMTPQANINFLETNALLMKTLFSKKFDLQEGLKKLSCKTLIIHGDKDPIPLSTVRTLHESIKNSQMFVIEACGHFPYVEKPQELFDALTAFFKESDD